MSNVQISRKSADKAGLTLADLNQFVQEAEQAGVDPRHPVTIRTGWRSQILQITAGGPR